MSRRFAASCRVGFPASAPPPRHPGMGARGRERVHAGAAIFEQRQLGWAIAPAKQAALVDGMQRVDKHESASKRKSSRDATVAESRHDLDFRRACKASLGQPCRQFVEKGLRSCRDYTAVRSGFRTNAKLTMSAKH